VVLNSIKRLNLTNFYHNNNKNNNNNNNNNKNNNNNNNNNKNNKVKSKPLELFELAGKKTINLFGQKIISNIFPS
jgi:predicted glycosyltransferase involved in capsule biosynthesis